jgi:uncharacterized membrane protein YdbT with pleckstrin-like domain
MGRQPDLLPDETLLLSVNRHPVVIISRTLPVAIGGLVLVIGGIVVPLGALESARPFILLVIALAVFVYLDIQYIVWRSESYTITDQRIILKRGVLSRFTRSIGMGRIQDVSTFQGVVGRVFDYGSVEVESAGRDGAEVLTYVPDPTRFRNVLFETLHGEGGAQDHT